MTTHFDEKIMNFDVANGYDAFMELFTMEDVCGMLEVMYGGEYDVDDIFQECKQDTIATYVKDWLVEAIKYDTIFGTRQLFNVWEMVG